MAMLGSPASASDEDTQLWLYMNTVVPLGKNATGTFELSPRFRPGGDQFLSRATVDFKLSPAVSLGEGAAYVENHGAADEFRPHQQLTLTTGPLAFRTRVEERFFAGADRMQLRLRERAQLSESVAKDTKLAATAEVLYIALPENRTSKARVDSWRASASLQHRFSKHIDGTLGYLLIYSPKEGAPDKIDHVPQITLTARL
ncbi:MAG: DUF2490 domain-containing protein [Porphyrobacter sp.]|nr:DUF2490 domain-containing protein [Porphyrobacter sp.]